MMLVDKQHNIVYKIVNKVDGNSYIGVHKTNNLADGYMGSGVIIRQAIAKYGVENFNREILFDFSSYEKALEKEKELVDDAFLSRKDTYNLRRGGSGGFDYINDHQLQNTELNSLKRKERIPKMTQAYKEHLADPEFREKIKQNSHKATQRMKVLYPDGVWIGRRHKPETKRKISEKMKGRITTSTLGKHWFTDGKNSMLALECPKGWRRGRALNVK